MVYDVKSSSFKALGMKHFGFSSLIWAIGFSLSLLMVLCPMPLRITPVVSSRGLSSLVSCTHYIPTRYLSFIEFSTVKCLLLSWSVSLSSTAIYSTGPIIFFDDSTSVVSFKNTSQMSSYCSNYFQVLESFYNTNRLKINTDKTQMCVNYPAKYSNECRKFSFQTGIHVIKNQTKI